MKDIISEFENYLVDNEKAESTVKAYINSIINFSQWLVEQDINLNSDLEKINYAKLLEYRHCLTSQNLAPNTINRKINVLKTFFMAMVDLEIIEKNPTIKLKKVKNTNKQKKIPTIENFEAIKETIENKKIDGRAGDLRSTRDGVIINFLLGLGLRSSELRNLKLKDIEADGKMTILGKGSKERTLYLNKQLREIYNSYLKIREEYLKKIEVDTDLVFVSYRGKMLGADVVNNILKKESKALGIDCNISAHSFRHAFITQKIKEGYDIKTVAELVGHSRTSTTLDVYTHSFSDDIKKALGVEEE